MDTTRRRHAGPIRRAGRAALSHWRWFGVGLFCLAFDYLVFTFWQAASFWVAGGNSIVRLDTARDTVIGTGSLLVILTAIVIWLLFRGRGRRCRPDHGDGSGGDSVHHAAAD